MNPRSRRTQGSTRLRNFCQLPFNTSSNYFGLQASQQTRYACVASMEIIITISPIYVFAGFRFLGGPFGDKLDSSGKYWGHKKKYPFA
jgi:hypothetical protein